jgi:serine/threonine protein kinase/transcriptional regulator with XRE-family HTH domain
MSSDESPAFGVLLSRYRVAVGLTQEELAERAALSAQAISALERGIRSRPRPYTVRQLTEALGLDGRDRELFERAAREAADSPDADTVLSTGDFLGALPATELVARVEELERFRSILGIVADGAGHLVLMGGEVGVGKTRLLQELMREASARGFVTLTGRCYPAEQETAYYPFLGVFSSLVASLPANGRIEGQRLSRRIHELAGGNAAGRGAGAETGVDRQQLFDAVNRLLLVAARSAPLALLLDDLHWADAHSLKLLQHLVHGTRNARVLLAVSFRDVQVGEEHPELAQMLQALSRDRLVERLTVRRLSLDETTALVASTMGQTDVSEEFASFVYRRTKGVPRLIDQLVRSLGGRIELRGEIGAGSMGRVFRAFDRVSQRDVAAKLVLARREIDLDTLLRFQQEGAVLATLDHPNIVDIYDTFAEEHASCILMELLEGRSLGTILHDGPLPLPRAKGLAGQVVEALSYAHSQGIVHRDIKPDNVMVLADDQVKVTDFGIARILQPDTSLQTIATTGMRMGTPLYMAPEQIEGKKIDGRTDIYALGAMLYHMVTGRPPFEGADALAVAVKHLQEEPVPPSQIDPAIPTDWDALILKAMAKDPARRFQSAQEFNEALASLGEQDGPPARTTKSTRLLAFAGALAAILAAVLVGVLAHIATASHASSPGARIDAYLSSLAAQGKLSGTVLVARHSSVLLDEGYGLADRRDGVPSGPTTLYGAAGLEVSLSTVDMMRAIETGTLSRRSKICRYLPHCPASWQPITVQQVLDGSANFPDNNWGLVGNTTLQSVQGCQSTPFVTLLYRSSISPACTALVMGTILERVFNGAWPSGVPGQIGVTHFGRLTDAFLPPQRAADYNGSTLDTRTVYNDYFALYATASDVYAFDNALFGGQILTPRDTNALFAPAGAVGTPDPGIKDQRWGYWWKIGRLFGRRVVYTYENLNDFLTVNMRFPQAGVTVVALSNDDSNDALGIAIHSAALALGEHPPVSAPISTAANPPALLGTYQRIFHNADRLAAHDPGLQNWVGQKFTLKFTKSYVVYDNVGQEYYHATADGRLELLDYTPENPGGSFCSTLPHENPPPGSYHWSLTKSSLVLTRIDDNHCPDRASLAPGVWQKTAQPLPNPAP